MKFIIYLFLPFILLSCSQDENNISSDNKIDQIEVKKPKDEILFRYKGHDYFTQYEISDDSVYIYQNEEVGLLIEKLNEANTSMLINIDGTIQYYDSLEELLTSNLTNNTTKSTSLGNLYEITDYINNGGNASLNGKLAHVQFFQDANFLGENIIFMHDENPNHIGQVSNIGHFKIGSRGGNWNDRVSSLKIKGGYSVILYQDANFLGRTIVFSAPKGNSIFNIPSLRDYKVGKSTWNDFMTSFKLFIW